MSYQPKAFRDSESLLPFTNDDVPLSPPRSPQWRAAPIATIEPQVGPNRLLAAVRRVLSEAAVAICLTLWCIFVSAIAGELFGAIGVSAVKGSYRFPQGPNRIPLIGKGWVPVLIGSCIVSTALGCGGHLLWTLTHLRSDPIKLGKGHPLVWVVSILAIISGGFVAALGVAVHPGDFVSVGFTTALALKLYGIGLGIVAGSLAVFVGLLALYSAVCGSK